MGVVMEKKKGTGGRPRGLQRNLTYRAKLEHLAQRTDLFTVTDMALALRVSEWTVRRDLRAIGAIA